MARTQRLAQPESFGKYQLTALLAKGRMGNVYKAKSHGLEGFERVLVVKTVDTAFASIPGFVDQVVREAQRTVTLVHANVVQVLDLGQEETGRVYITSEFVNGLDLGRARKIARHLHVAWPMELSIYIISEIAKGLDYAHRRKDFNFNRLNLMHHDLAPSNIMLSLDGEVKLTDFGIINALSIVPPMDDEERIRRVLYQAPEALNGHYTQQSDVFSAGMVLYELLTGEHPYLAASADETVRRAFQAQIPPLSQRGDIPRALAQIVDSALAPDPAARTNNSGQLSEELLGYIYSNNLSHDARELGVLVQDLKRDEPDVLEEESTQTAAEPGIPELSMSDIQVPEGLSLYGSAIPNPSREQKRGVATPPPLPVHVQAQRVPEQRGPSRVPTGTMLPPSLEEHVQPALGGAGRAVLLHGQFGAGQNYLLDRLPHLLGQRPNVYTQAVQVNVDDAFRPFGALGDVMLASLRDLLDADAEGLVPLALARLRELGAEPVALDALGALWGMEGQVLLGYDDQKKALANAFVLVLRAFGGVAPVVIIDRADHLDPFSMDVLRVVISAIGGMPALLMLSSAKPEQTQVELDPGVAGQLAVVKVVGEVPPKLRDIQGLTSHATRMLAALAIEQQPTHQSVLAELLHIPDDQLTSTISELVKLGVVRIPSPGYLFAARPELMVWASEQIGAEEIRALSRQLWRLRAPARDQEISRDTPARIRLGALAGLAYETRVEGSAYIRWLLQRGWSAIALELFGAITEMIKGSDANTPELQISLLMRRAELALELARQDLCMESLAALHALTGRLRQERAVVRGRLLEGALELHRDDLDEARRLFVAAAESAHGLSDSRLIVRASVALASWYDRFGDARRADDALATARNLQAHIDQLDPELHAELLHLSVRSACALHTPRLARSYVEELTALATHHRSPEIQCRAEAARARLARAEGGFPAALKLLVSAERNARRYRLHALHIDIMRQHAIAAMEARNYKHAQRITKALIALSSTHGDLYSEQRGHDMYALCCCMMGVDVPTSLQHLQQSLARAEQRRVPKDAMRNHQFLADAFAALNQAHQAEAHALEARRLQLQMSA